jgi:hypothetical protein
MSTVFDELERELRHAVSASARKHRRLHLPSRERAIAFALGATLIVSASALAASGVIPFGSPAERVPDGNFETQSGRVIPGSVKLLPVTGPDPAGGPPWGMRVFDTQRGEGCLEVGRLEDRKLGAIGADGAFDDDGLFHVLAANTFGAEKVCGLRDGAGKLFLNGSVKGIPASAWAGGYRNPGCVVAHVSHAERYINGTRLPTCPASSERDVYYGLLGPDAQSITYAIGGQRHTIPTAGGDGAYVLVVPHQHGETSNFKIDLNFDEAAPLRGPITEIHYRGGRTCRLVASGIGAEQRCSSRMALPVDRVAPKPPPSTAAAASPVHVRLVRVAGGYDAVVSFASKVALSNARSSYEIEWSESGRRPGIRSFGWPQPLYPKRGQRVSEQLRSGLRKALSPGRLTGEVTLDYRARIGEPSSTKRLVGRFAVTIPR